MRDNDQKLLELPQTLTGTNRDAFEAAAELLRQREAIGRVKSSDKVKIGDNRRIIKGLQCEFDSRTMVLSQK